MRIAVFIKRTTLHKGYGGIETQNKVLCEGLAKRGHELVVFSPQRELSQSTWQQNGVSYCFVSCSFRSYFGFEDLIKTNWSNRSYREFESEHHKKQFNVILSQSSAGIGVIKRKSLLGVPILAIAHGTVISEYLTFLREVNFINPFSILKFIKNTGFVAVNFFTRQRQYIHGADKVIAVSSYVKRALIDETFVAQEKIEIVHNGIDELPEIGAVEASPSIERLHFLYVGRLEKSKGVLFLLDILSDKRFEGIVVDVIGDGPLRSTLTSVAAKKGISKRFVVYGQMSHEAVLQFMSTQGPFVFVFPTLRVEGFPMALVEAMAAGLPTVASDIGGVADAVVNEVTGFLCRPGDVEDLKSKLEKLMNDSALTQKLGAAGRQKALLEFSIDGMLNAYERIIVSL